MPPKKALFQRPPRSDDDIYKELTNGYTLIDQKDVRLAEILSEQELIQLLLNYYETKLLMHSSFEVIMVVCGKQITLPDYFSELASQILEQLLNKTNNALNYAIVFGYFAVEVKQESKKDQEGQRIDFELSALVQDALKDLDPFEQSELKKASEETKKQKKPKKRTSTENYVVSKFAAPKREFKLRVLDPTECQTWQLLDTKSMDFDFRIFENLEFNSNTQKAKRRYVPNAEVCMSSTAVKKNGRLRTPVLTCAKSIIWHEYLQTLFMVNATESSERFLAQESKPVDVNSVTSTIPEQNDLNGRLKANKLAKVQMTKTSMQVAAQAFKESQAEFQAMNFRNADFDQFAAVSSVLSKLQDFNKQNHPLKRPPYMVAAGNIVKDMPAPVMPVEFMTFMERLLDPVISMFGLSLPELFHKYTANSAKAVEQSSSESSTSFANRYRSMFAPFIATLINKYRIDEVEQAKELIAIQIFKVVGDSTEVENLIELLKQNMELRVVFSSATNSSVNYEILKKMKDDRCIGMHNFVKMVLSHYSLDQRMAREIDSDEEDELMDQQAAAIVPKKAPKRKAEDPAPVKKKPKKTQEEEETD
jgi:hypothetical protein